MSGCKRWEDNKGDEITHNPDGTKIRPPRTFLQRLASEVNWFVGCRLQQISSHALPVRTMPILRKLEVYNQAVADLQEAIKYNYRCQATQHKKAEASRQETANAI